MNESGVLNINKPQGVTSYWVVNQVKKILKLNKVGHSGTLDPLATGVLIVLFGKATKLQDSYMNQNKVYLAEVLFGVQTDTGDITGKIIKEDKNAVVSKEALLGVTGRFIGDIKQLTPMYSAVKRNGRHLYDLAREGITIERPPRIVSIYSIDVLDFKDNTANIRVECSTGTYIRTLAEDLGTALSTCATLKSLVREKAGEQRVENALDGKLLQTIDKETLLKHAINFEAI